MKALFKEFGTKIDTINLKGIRFFIIDIRMKSKKLKKLL
jgi:hypothetical protein